jgi:hypothetical protein
VRGTDDGGKWFDEEIDTKDVSDGKCLIEAIFFHASVSCVSESADIFHADNPIAECSFRQYGDIRRPVSVVTGSLQGKKNGKTEDREGTEGKEKDDHKKC